MEIIFGALIFLFFLGGIIHGMHEAKNKPKSNIAKVTVTVERKPAKKQEPAVDKTVYNEAKETLKLYGFSVKEAKELLDKAGPHDNADEWAQAAVKKVKI